MSHLIKDVLLGKDLVITPKMSYIRILHMNFCLSKKEIFQETACPKVLASKVPASGRYIDYSF